MNGASGLSSFSTSSTVATEYGAVASASRIARASASVLAENFAPFHSASSAWKRSASADDPAGATVAVIFQYSSETNARISFSRSAIRRTATDWTLPALRPRATLSQSRGLSW